jgi:hypothetical protein
MPQKVRVSGSYERHTYRNTKANKTDAHLSPTDFVYLQKRLLFHIFGPVLSI